MPVTVVRLSAVALAAVFTWSAAAKTIGWRTWVETLRGYRLPPPLERIAAPGTVAAEALLAGLLLAGATRAGAALVLALVASFSLAILRARALHGDRLPCGCFGGRAERDYRAMIMRNVVLGGAAAVILVGGRDVALVGDVRAPDASETLPAVLVALGIVILGWLARHALGSMRGRRS